MVTQYTHQILSKYHSRATGQSWLQKLAKYLTSFVRPLKRYLTSSMEFIILSVVAVWPEVCHVKGNTEFSFQTFDESSGISSCILHLQDIFKDVDNLFVCLNFFFGKMKKVDSHVLTIWPRFEWAIQCWLQSLCSQTYLLKSNFSAQTSHLYEYDTCTWCMRQPKPQFHNVEDTSNIFLFHLFPFNESKTLWFCHECRHKKSAWCRFESSLYKTKSYERKQLLARAYTGSRRSFNILSGDYFNKISFPDRLV